MTCVLVWSGLYSVAIQFVKLLLACCRQHGSNILRAGDIRLVGATCNKPDQVAKLVIQDAKNLFQTCQTAWNKQCQSVWKLCRARGRCSARTSKATRAKCVACAQKNVCAVYTQYATCAGDSAREARIFREQKNYSASVSWNFKSIMNRLVATCLQVCHMSILSI